MNFKNWLENKQFTNMKPSDIDHWSNYSANKIFKSPEEARQWIFARKEHSDKSSWAELFGPDGPEYNKAFAEAMPIYQSGKSFKIGKRIRTDNRLRLSNLEVKRPSLQELNVVAQANGESDYKFHPTKWVKFPVGNKDVYATQSSELNKIASLAEEIKQNGWIEAVIYDWNSGYLIEGQHRVRALRLLGFKTAPGVGIEYF